MVVEYLKRPSNSYELPSKKNQVWGNGVFGLTDTMQNLHRKFGMNHPDIKISLPVFCRARPKYIHLIRYTARRHCLCRNHANVALVVDVVSVLPKSPALLVQLEDDEIRGKLDGLSCAEVRYKNWHRTDVLHSGKEYLNVKLMPMVTSTAEFTNSFIEGMADFRRHCQRVTIQYDEIRMLKECMAEHTEATVQMDYSENMVCRYQDEVSAVVYDKTHVTIHPMVLH